MTARSKFGAKRSTCAAGHRHDSKLEAGRCDDLAAMEARGEITHLAQQPEFPIRINDTVVCTYRADFGYRMGDSGLPIVLDVKGMTTPVFNLKRKLVEAAYPGTVITIWPPKVRKRRASRKAAA